MNRTSLKKMAQERIEDSAVLLANHRWTAAYYLSGYSVELALKACILKFIEQLGIIFVDKKSLHSGHNRAGRGLAMDTTALVADQIAEGQRLLEHLDRNGFEVSAAFWVLASETDTWFLFIASPLADGGSISRAYSKLYAAMSGCQLTWISRSDIKLVAPTSPIAVDAIDNRQGRVPTRYRGRQLGDMIVEEAHIYPRVF